MKGVYDIRVMGNMLKNISAGNLGEKDIIDSEGLLKPYTRKKINLDELTAETIFSRDVIFSVSHGQRLKRSIDDICKPALILPSGIKGVTTVNFGEDGGLARSFHTPLLKQINPSRYNILLNTMSNLKEISNIAINNMTKMKDAKLEQHFFNNTASKASAADIKNKISQLDMAIKVFNSEFDTRFLISDVSFDDQSLLAQYNSGIGKIILNNRSFDYPHNFTQLLLHEISHAIGTLDYFYYNSFDRNFPPVSSYKKEREMLDDYIIAERECLNKNTDTSFAVSGIGLDAHDYFDIPETYTDQQKLEFVAKKVIADRTLSDVVSLVNADTLTIYAMCLSGLGNKGKSPVKIPLKDTFNIYLNPEASVFSQYGSNWEERLPDQEDPQLAVPDDVQQDRLVLAAINQAEDFQHGMKQLYIKNVLPAREWLPLLGSLRDDESRPGSNSLQFINTARPELSPYNIMTDDRRIIDFVNNYNKNLAMVSKTHEYIAGQFSLREGIPEAEGVNGLNSAFIVKTLIPWFAGKSRTAVAGDPLPGTLNTALRVHAWVNMTQMAHGALEDSARLVSLYRVAASEGRSVTDSLFSPLSHVSTGAGVGLNIASVVLDSIELAHAQNESQKAVSGTQLSFDSAALVATGVGTGAGYLGASTVAVFAESLAVPLAGLGIGFTALAEAFGLVASDAQAVGNYFADLKAAYQNGGYRQVQRGTDTVMEPISGAVISKIDLRQRTLMLDSQYLYRNNPKYSLGSGRSNYFFWWPGRSADTDKNHAINIREGIGSPQEAKVNFRPDNDILILPATPKSYINYEYTVLPFVTGRNDRGFDVLRQLEEDERFDFDFYAFPGERVVRRIWQEYVATPVDVILDDSDRDIVIPSLPEVVHGNLSFHLNGGNGRYRISLQEGVSLSLDGNSTGTHWVLDARHIDSTDNISISEDGRQLQVGSMKITLTETLGNISLLNNKGFFTVEKNKVHQWQITEVEADGSQFKSLQALHEHLRKLSNPEHHSRPYVTVDHYQPSPESGEVGRAFYETGRDRLIYTNRPEAAAFLSQAELAKVDGDKAWFYRDAALWQVDIASGEVLRQYLPVKFPGSDQGKISSHVMQGDNQLWFVVEQERYEGRVSYIYQVEEVALKLVAVDGNNEMLAGLDTALPVLPDAGDNELNELLAPLAVNQWFSDDSLSTPELQVKGSLAAVLRLSGRVAGADRHYWLHSDGKQRENVVRMNRINPEQEDAGILAGLKKNNPAWPALTADFTIAFITDGDKPGYYFYSLQRQRLYFQVDAGLSGSPARVVRKDIRSVAMISRQLLVITDDGTLWLADDKGSTRLAGVTADWLQHHRDNFKVKLSQLTRDTDDRFSSLLLQGLQDSNGKPVSAWYDSTADRVVRCSADLSAGHNLAYLGLSSHRQHAWLLDSDSGQLYRQPLAMNATLTFTEKEVFSAGAASAEQWPQSGQEYRRVSRQDDKLRLETQDGAVLLLSADAGMTDLPMLIAWHAQGRTDGQIAAAIESLRNKAELPPAVRLLSEPGQPVAWYLPEQGKTLRASVLNPDHALHYLGQVAGQEAGYVHDQTTGKLWSVSEEKSTPVGNYRFVNRTAESLVLQVGEVMPGEKIRPPQLAGTNRVAITGRSAETYYWLSSQKVLAHYRHITIDDRGQDSVIRFSDTWMEMLSFRRSGGDLVLSHHASDTSIRIVNIEQAAHHVMRLEIAGTALKIRNLLNRMDRLTQLNPDVDHFKLIISERGLK